jgi:hypothetical protein
MKKQEATSNKMKDSNEIMQFFVYRRRVGTLLAASGIAVTVNVNVTAWRL